jgi:tetratricopeptide (TPR) repeat protein
MKKHIPFIPLILMAVFLPMVIGFSQPTNNSDVNDWVAAGYRAYSSGDWKNALILYRQVVSIPGHSTEENWYMLIISEIYAGESLQAVQDAEHFFTLFPASPYNSYVRYQAGRAYFMMGNYVNTVFHLTEFCHSYPNHELYPAALFWIAESFFAQKNYDAAKALYERIVTSYPRDPKRPDAQARLETIRWIENTNAQLEILQKQAAGGQASAQSPASPVSPLSAVPMPVAAVSARAAIPAALAEQQQFIATLIEINASLENDKQKIVSQRKMLADVLARNSAQSALQWTPGQQRLIADLVIRTPMTSAGTEMERRVMELLARSAEMNARTYRPEERQTLITDVQNADNTLYEEQKKIEGQQRLIAELITSSMGLSESGNNVSVTASGSGGQTDSIDRNLSLLESQFTDVRKADEQSVASEYANLLRKARLLWAYIVEQNQY